MAKEPRSARHQGNGQPKIDLRTLKERPPWQWPEGTDRLLLSALRNDQETESNLLLATEMAGKVVVINDEMVEALIAILRNSSNSEELRSRAAISLGPVLEDCDLEGFDEDADHPITEQTFHKIQETLQELYMDCDHVPTLVRRRILEASVRASEDWHREAVRDAFSNGDENWKATAVFCMQYVHGLDDEILEALESKNPDIQYEAVRAAGARQVDEAWPHVTALVDSPNTEKSLLLAAIQAIASIRPHEAPSVLNDLGGSTDKEIALAVDEALDMAESFNPADDHLDE